MSRNREHDASYERGADAPLPTACAQAKKGLYCGQYRAELQRYRASIQRVLECGYTLKLAWESFVEVTGSSISYQSFRRHCRALGIERRRAKRQGADRGRGAGAPERSALPPKAETARFGSELPVFQHSPVPELDQVYGDD